MRKSGLLQPLRSLLSGSKEWGIAASRQAALPSARANGFRFNGSGGAYPAPLSESSLPGDGGDDRPQPRACRALRQGRRTIHDEQGVDAEHLGRGAEFLLHGGNELRAEERFGLLLRLPQIDAVSAIRGLVITEVFAHQSGQTGELTLRRAEGGKHGLARLRGGQLVFDDHRMHGRALPTSKSAMSMPCSRVAHPL